MGLFDSIRDLGAPVNNKIKSTQGARDSFDLDAPTNVAPVAPDEPASDAESLLDKSIKRTEDVIAGRDPFTQQMMQRSAQTSAASAAAQKAAQRQQMTQQGMDAAFQQTAYQQAERDRGTQRAQEAGELAESLGRRQDAASAQLAQLAQTKQYMDEADRNTKIENYKEVLGSTDLTTADSATVNNVLKMGKDLYGEDYSLDKATQQQWDTKLDKVSTDAVTHLATTFGPDSGRDFPVNPGTDIVDWQNLDAESKKHIESWYEAYSQGDDFYDEDTNSISMEAQEWLNNKIKDITITEAERMYNLGMKELETLFEPGTPEYDLAKQQLDDSYAYSILGRDTKLPSEEGPLSGEMSYDKITGEVTLIDGSKYDRGGYDEELGIYGYNKKTDSITFEDGEEFKMKDGTLQIKGEDGKFADYTGADAGRIKNYFSATGEETDAALESAKEGEVFVSNNGELMFKEGGQAVPFETVNPTETDFKRLMNLDSLANVPAGQVSDFLRNYDGTSYEKLELTERLIDESNFEALKELAKSGGAHASQEPLTKFRKLYKGQAIELDGTNYIAIDEGPRLKDGAATYSRLIDSEGNIVYWVRVNGTGNKSGNWSNWVQTDRPTIKNVTDKGLNIIGDEWM